MRRKVPFRGPIILIKIIQNINNLHTHTHIMGHLTTVSTRLATLTPSFPSKCPKASPLRNFSTKIYPFGSSFTGALGIGDKGLTTSLPNITPKSVEFLQESTDPATGSVLVSPLPSSSSSHQQPTRVRCGWGHSVWTRGGDLFVAGKPHDFQTLLRMNRLPGERGGRGLL
jgi:hypothetical protein